MLQAFQDCGHDVLTVMGYGRDRERAIRRIESVLKSGKKISFVYSEARSIPTLLTERHRLPTFPLMDFAFLRNMRGSGVPTGLFYRDVFWRFKMYRRRLSLPARAITIPLYHYDWWWYKKVVDHLFLPSEAMGKFLPSHWPNDRLSALPPGIPATSQPAGQCTQPGKSLDLLYIGGVHPPAYDLTPLFDAVKTIGDVSLTLCCREPEWRANRLHYEPLDHKSISVVHQEGEALLPLYQQADLFSILWKNHEYLDFAAPVKLFESVGRGVPIVTFKGSETARLVRQNDWGWVVDGQDDLVSLLDYLKANPKALEEKRAALIGSRDEHSWIARAREAAQRIQQHAIR